MIPEANKPNMIEGPIILGHPDRGAHVTLYAVNLCTAVAILKLNSEGAVP